MEDLARAGLIGAGRYHVHTPVMVSRYNQALKRIGVTPTTLNEFWIDGIGWSPEIAQEKRNLFYLFQGEANRCAIILTPDQQGKPIYFPYASYERELMQAYFNRFRRHIADITTTHPAVLIFDQEITRYETPLDLLLDYVVVRTDTCGLSETTALQIKLAEELSQDDEWIDSSLRSRLAESGKQYGDLRFRDTQIPDLRFDECQNFYTEAFGGVFVLRAKKEILLVLADWDRSGFTRSDPKSGIRAVKLDDPNLPDLLLEKGYTDVNLRWYAEHPEALQDMRKCLIATLITEAVPELPSYLSLSEAHRKSILAKVPAKQTRVLSALERLEKRLRRDDKDLSEETLDDELTLLLMRPSAKGRQPKRDPRTKTVSILLSRLRAHDPLELYRADKNLFVSRFKTWSLAYQGWAAVRIKECYEPVMNQSTETEERMDSNA